VHYRIRFVNFPRQPFALLLFTNSPDAIYRLQRAACVTGTWTDLAIPRCGTPGSGLIEYHEASPPPGQAFYRTVQP